MTLPEAPVGLKPPVHVSAVDCLPPDPSAPTREPDGRSPARPVIVTRPGEGVTRAARAARARTFRRRRLVALGFVIVAVVAAVVVGVSPVRDGLARLVPSSPGPAPATPASSVLLAWPGADGGATIVLVGAPGVAQGSALLIPGGTQVEVPSFGSETLSAAFLTGGPDTLALAVENALGYDVGNVIGLDVTQLTALLSPSAPLDVRLREAVRIGDRTFPPAAGPLTAADLALLATTRSDESADFDHLVVVHALLEAWLEELDDRSIEATRAVLAGIAGVDESEVSQVVAVLEELSSRHVTFDTLDVVSLGVPGEERYRVDEIGAAEEMDALFPGLAFADVGPRVRVEILNGTGTAGIATEAARRLVPEGAQVVLTGNTPTFGINETMFVLQDSGAEPDAKRLVEALGIGRIRMASNPLGVADISIVLGADFDPGGE